MLSIMSQQQRSSQCPGEPALADSGCVRQKWLFKPRDSPEQLSSMPEVAAPSELHPEPFKWRPQQRLEGSFEMVDGVVKYYADETGTHEPYPVPGSSLEFFTDMHR